MTAVALGLAAAACGNEGGGNAVSTDANLGEDSAVNDVLGMNQAGVAAATTPMTPAGFANAAAASDQFEIESAKLALASRARPRSGRSPSICVPTTRNRASN